MGALENIKETIGAKNLRKLPYVALILGFALAVFGMWAYANLNVAYDETAPVTIKQEIEKADTQDTWFTVQFKDKASGETYRQAIRIPATETSGDATVLLKVYREYEISVSVAQSAWRYDNTSATYTNSQELGGNDEWSATDAGDSKTKLPATLKIGTLDKPVFDRTITLKSKLSREQWFSDTAAVVNKIKFPAQKTIEFDNQGHGNEIKNQYVVEGDKVTEPTKDEVGTSAGLTFEGWYTDAKCTVANKYNFDTAVGDVANKLTLYANWVPSTEAGGDEDIYWISPAKAKTTGNTDATSGVANDNYVKEEWNVKKSSSEIQADVDVLSDTDHSKYDYTEFQRVKAEYTSFMKNDDYHLFTKIGDGTDLNDYAEFRIIQVTEHDSDGSALTFQATHALPDTVQMNTAATNAGGFGASNLATQMNSGSVFNLFNPRFTDDVMTVSKNYMKGEQSTETESADFKFWIVGYSELIVANTQFDDWLTKYSLAAEGSQYDFFANLGISGASTATNPAIATLAKDRSGTSVGVDSGNGYSWERTPDPRSAAGNLNCFLNIKTDGYCINGNILANAAKGVVPCFSLGTKKIVKFDNQDHGNEVESQTLEYGDKVVEPTADEVGTSKGLTFEGWYRDAKCSKDMKWDFDNDKVEVGMTLYANWVPSTEDDGDANAYWFSPSYKVTTTNPTGTAADSSSSAVDNDNYVKEAWNVKKSRAELQADIAVLEDTAHKTYTEDRYNEVFAEYTAYMNNDNFHLYTKVGTGDALNNFVEFRIIQVGAHDDDGSVLTFMATHTLPKAYAISSDGTNNGGWAATIMRKNMNPVGYVADGEGGEIFDLFKTGFTDDISPIEKMSNGGMTSAEVTGSLNYFWILSSREVYEFGTNDGSVYQWFANIGIGYKDNRALAQIGTRSGGLPSGATSSKGWIIGRTARTATSASWGGIDPDGHPEAYQLTGSTGTKSTVPCFAFGGFNVTFDLQGHTATDETTPTNQIVGAGETVTAPTDPVDKNGELTFAGWYKDTSFADAQKWDFDTDTISENTTLYAYWKPNTEKYWIAPASKKTTGNTAATANAANTWDKTTNPNGYNSELKNIKKSSAEIQEDVKVLNDVDHVVYTADKYNEVFEEYEKFVENDSYHLYCKYNKSTGTGANDYLEFRILEVGEHNNAGTDTTDGSVLSFQLTHSLPNAYPWSTKTDSTSASKETARWKTSYMRTLLSSGGAVYNQFPTALTNDIMSVTKKTSVGGNSNTIEKVTDKLWLASEVEMLNGTVWAATGEGTVYDYWKKIGLNPTTTSGGNKAFTCLITTRAGTQVTGNPTGHSAVMGCYWLRSVNGASKGKTNGVSHLSNSGTVNNTDNNAFYTVPIGPCFSLGVDYTVKFNNNGGSGTMSDQTGRFLNDGVKLTANGFTKDGYGFKCWNTEADGSGTSFSDKEAANIAFSGESTVTLYAQWVELGDYWIAPAHKSTTSNAAATVNAAYTNSETGVVKNRAQIQEDVKVLNDTGHATYTAEKYEEVYNEYKEYMDNDSYHLYSKWEGAAASARAANNYVEFRIVNIGDHLAGTTAAKKADGSVLTFMMTHSLTTSYPYNETQTNMNGWAGSNLYTRLNSSTGYFYTRFAAGLRSDALKVTKYSTKGGGTAAAAVTALTSATSQFWVPSCTELTGFTEAGYCDEGNQYQYFKDVVGLTSGGTYDYALKGIHYDRAGTTKPTCGSYARGGDYIVLRSPNTTGNQGCAWEQTENCTREYHHAGTAYWNSVTPCFALGVGYTVKFDNNGGTGNMADQTRTLNDNVALTANGFTKDGYGFTTWNTEADGSGTSYTDKQVANLAVEGQTTVTLYAQWKELKDYWIAPAYKKATTNVAPAVNSAYTNPETGVVKNSEEIQADVKILSDTDHSTYSEEKYNEVFELYEQYMQNDSYHLYCKYNGSATRNANDYVEFRILEVGEHSNSATETDGSSLTFQATHVLPNSVQMNTAGVNTGGWRDSTLRTSMNSGVVYGYFPATLSNDIMTITKKTTQGNNSATVLDSSDKWWVASTVEVAGGKGYGYDGEGTEYAYWSMIGTDSTANNAALAPFGGTKRDGTDQGDTDSGWLRGPSTQANCFTRIMDTPSGRGGNPNYFSAGASSNRALVPAFAFGYNVVKFETGGGTEIDDQILKYGATATEPEAPTLDGYDFDGWYTDATYATKFDFTKGITKDTTIYAKWTPVSESYWMTFADSSTPEVNVVKTKSQIQADVAVLKDTAHATYTAEKYDEVKSEYESFMNGTRGTVDSEIHLYTKVGDGTTEDDYAEFRLLQVGEHDTDGSVLTFNMTHVLPDAQAMNATKTNSGGWATSDLHTKMQADAGEIFTTFKETLTDDIFAPTKSTMNGDKDTATTDTTDKLWSLSAVEVYGLTESGYASEGVQYDYYANKAIVKSDDTNDVLAYRTRSGGLPDGQDTSREAGEEYCSWWLRTPSLLNEQTWCRVYSDGRIDHNYSDIKRGVSVAFCF